MATAPWFVLSPNALLSVVGLLRGPDKTVPTPAEDWQQAVVDVVATEVIEPFVEPLLLAQQPVQAIGGVVGRQLRMHAFDLETGSAIGRH